jgi:putative addiction module killer protein
VIDVRQTEAFEEWFDGVRDRVARFRVAARIRLQSLGNAGDVRSVGEGVIELRIPHGPGYRDYFVRTGPNRVVLLSGGTKSSQRRDIERAKEIASTLGGGPR